MSDSLPRVVLLPKRARPFYGRHPWVFAGAVDRVEGDPADGAEVDLVTDNGAFVARGFYNAQSKIRVRLLSWDAETRLDEAFFRTKIQSAIRLRDTLGLNGPGRGCRLVFSEGDGLSGLTVDRYDDWLVVQFTSLGLAQRRDPIAGILNEAVRPAGIYLRTEKGIGQLEGLPLVDGPLNGAPPAGPIRIEEHGLKVLVNLAEGQKTGYYLDQRDNRQEVARLSRGRRVLDAFCYSGGFGLHAARAGAAEVVGVDGSAPALALAEENARLNELGNISFHKADVFVDLEQRVERGERFGVVVLDPPKFARSRAAVDDAMKGYGRLQTMALRLLEPDGILATCCCSGLITGDMLEGQLAHVAALTRRDVQLLQRRGPSMDHPVAVGCLETHYLKCLVARAV
jgi:23S rRNA (cytosine1962-C5)-methyltransferase